MAPAQKALLLTCLSFATALAALPATAEVAQLWHCELKEGKTEADEKVGNDRYIKFVNENVEGGGVRTFAGHPIVGNLDKFVYVDTFPSLEAWTEKEAAMQTEEGQRIEQALEETATCESSSLYRVVRSE